MQENFFVKSHGLGNDYIVLDEAKLNFSLNEKAIRDICDIHYGIGSDGILLHVPSSKADFGLKIFNPDASEAEKSGNGLRIFCKFLYDYGYVAKKEFTIETKGGLVKATIEKVSSQGKAQIITVDMGKAIFTPKEIPVKLGNTECLGEILSIGGKEAGNKEYEVNCVSVGNPHCVILKDTLDESEIKEFGPFIENHSAFPNRINVQFAKVLSRSEVQILIWERGAGYTLASGSSSCAVASIMKKRGLCDGDMTIHMPGGTLRIQIDDQWNIRMTGAVQEIANGVLSAELLETF
ncbi:MAG: diaminopimelate epimerase [Spirochaetae bacterium HGW-Spirochaetae-6]|jgi:diaminopimelate epimerase|nr:MAG: diaminopimelate epimerase [Spirochaetae bacterium HGW-Spirochaetae-6]